VPSDVGLPPPQVLADIDLAERLHQMRAKDLSAALTERGIVLKKGKKVILKARLFNYLDKRLHALEDDGDEDNERPDLQAAVQYARRVEGKAEAEEDEPEEEEDEGGGGGEPDEEEDESEEEE
jgi:hypothetical protein